MQSHFAAKNTQFQALVLPLQESLLMQVGIVCYNKRGKDFYNLFFLDAKNLFQGCGYNK